MTQTAHGYHIIGTIPMDEDPNMEQARCGGPGYCAECDADVERVLSGDVAPSDILGYASRVERVDAAQVFASNVDKIALWCGGEARWGGNSFVLIVPTLEGALEAAPSDFVIRSQNGRFRVMPRGAFDQKYERPQVSLDGV